MNTKTTTKPLFEDLCDFTKGYVTAAFWTMDDDAPSGEYSASGRPEAMYDKLTPEALRSMREDCQKFTESNLELMLESGIRGSRAGHCFWLNRNHHGSGFWDESTITREQGQALSDASHKFGECNLYFGDDGQLYLQ